MTNKEAIEILDKGIITDGEVIRSTGYREWCNMLTAIQMGCDALREKAEKERRFLVEKKETFGPYKVRENCRERYVVADQIKSEADAIRIADIYEGMYK